MHHPHGRRNQVSAGDADITEPLPQREGRPEQQLPRDQRQCREQQIHGAVAAGQRLKRKKPDREQQVASPAALEIAMQEGQRERDPLHRGHVQLAHANEARRCECENDTANKRAAHADVQTAREAGRRRPRTARTSAAPSDSSPSTMLPVSQMIGDEKNALPIRFSEYASVLAYGGRCSRRKCAAAGGETRRHPRPSVHIYTCASGTSPRMLVPGDNEKGRAITKVSTA